MGIMAAFDIFFTIPVGAGNVKRKRICMNE
jgi:hypothetical protein